MDDNMIRLEKKMDDGFSQVNQSLHKLDDAMISLARFEEKIAINSETHTRMFRQIDDLKEANQYLRAEVAEVQLKMATHEPMFSGIAKFSWLAVSAIIGGVVAWAAVKVKGG